MAGNLKIEVVMTPYVGRLGIEHFRQMEELEASFYPRNLITPAKESYRWYEMHPHSIVVACEDNRIVGFINLLPVRSLLFESILQGSFNDADLTAEDILPLPLLDKEPFGLFLSCIVIDRDHQGKGLSRELLAGAIEPYLPAILAFSPRVVTDNATRQGECFSRRMGFEYVGPSSHGTQVYVTEAEALARQLGVSFR